MSTCEKKKKRVLTKKLLLPLKRIHSNIAHPLINHATIILCRKKTHACTKIKGTKEVNTKTTTESFVN